MKKIIINLAMVFLLALYSSKAAENLQDQILGIPYPLQGLEAETKPLITETLWNNAGTPPNLTHPIETNFSQEYLSPMDIRKGAKPKSLCTLYTLENGRTSKNRHYILLDFGQY